MKKGVPPSPSKEVIEKIRQSNLGQKRSEDTKKNISEGLKRHWSAMEAAETKTVTVAANAAKSIIWFWLKKHLP